MRNKCKQMLSVLLCVVIAFSGFAIPAQAFAFSAAITASAGAVAKWLGFAVADATVGEVVSRISDYLAGKLDSVDFLAVRANIEAEGNRAETTNDVLHWIAWDWNANYAAKAGFNVKVVQIPTSTGEIYSAILCLVNPSGEGGRFGSGRKFEHYFADEYGRILCSNDTTETDGAWRPIKDISSPYYMLTREVLYNKAVDVGGVMQKSGTMYFIQNNAGTQVYVTPDGFPFAAWANEDGAAVNQDRPTSSGTVTDSAGNTTNIEGDLNYNTSIDMSGGTVSFPDGVVEELNSIIYDQSTKTYYVDSRDFSTTYNQSFSFYQYHINYTSVTYIGQTEEYNKYYEAYYELPDGRDSADLTKEDLEQLNISIDVIPYGRSSDNTSLRSLYHFDGDTYDASYWNYLTSFTWNKGASLTYMDAATFNGALYLDETEHDFTMKLPSRLASADFTLQFRYYQSYTAAPQSDSWIQLGDTKVMQFNGGSFLTGSGTVLAATPIGTWNELALIRDSGMMYYYLNGVCIGSVVDLSIYTDAITFHFGSDQQTYKYFDELRVLNYALQTGGANYECSAVPHDTNLSLVLPDSQLPVADEYWSFVNDQENLIDPKYADMISWGADTLELLDVGGYTGNWQRFFGLETTSYPSFSSNSKFTTLVNDGSSIVVLPAGSERFAGGHVYNASGSYVGYDAGKRYPIVGVFADVNVHDIHPLSAGTYTFSLVNFSGEIASVTFDVSAGFTGTQVLANAFGYDFGYYSLTNYFDDDGDSTRTTVSFLGIVPASDSPDGLVYMELVKGSETHLTAEWVESVTIFDKDDLNTPSLAVRTDIEISSHQIGGIRPSVPSKGQVWALVERNVITSLQIYTGTGWENVDGRIWTGSRWIPASSYNVITLQDMYDIADATPDYEYIYTESGFWDWWQRAWTDFTGKLFDQKGSGSSGAAGSIPAEVLPAVPDDEATEEDDSWNVLDLFVILKDGAWSVITGVVTTGFESFGSFAEGVVSISNFFGVYDRSNPTCITGMCDYGGDDIWA